jgi:hypothetical protein
MAARTRQAEAQLPLFEGFEIAKAEVAFGGKLALDLGEELDRELLAELRWGRNVEITLEVEGKAWRVAGQVESRGYKFVFEEADRIPTTTCRLVVDGRMVAPGEVRGGG